MMETFARIAVLAVLLLAIGLFVRLFARHCDKQIELIEWGMRNGE